MKKYLKEIIIIIIQLISLYLLSFLAACISKDAMVLTIFLNIIITFILSFIYSKISKFKLKYLYPLIVAVLFIPTSYIFYNEFILIYAIFHLVAAFIGIGIENLFKN